MLASNEKGLRDRISPTCTLSQNGYGTYTDIIAICCLTEDRNLNVENGKMIFALQ
jgi:hypothetical protein